MDCNPEKDGPLAAKTFVKVLCHVLEHFYEVRVSPEEIIVLDASTSKKFSQHVIFNSPSVIFENNLEQVDGNLFLAPDIFDPSSFQLVWSPILIGQLIRLTCHAIDTLSHTKPNPLAPETGDFEVQSLCPACSTAVNHLATVVLPSVQISATDARLCLARLDGSDTAAWGSICDLGVYSRNRNFRLAGSRKLTGTSILWPENTPLDASFNRYWPNWLVWASTLITYTSGLENHGSTLKRPITECQCAALAGLIVSPRIEEPLSTIDSNKASTVVSPMITLPEDELYQFIRRVVHHWHEQGRQSLRPTRNCFTNLPDTGYRILRHSAHHLTVSMDKLRYCERIERPHRSNRVILVFDLLKGCYYQKCLDPECASRNYRSQTRPVPSKFCAHSSSCEVQHNESADESATSFNDPDTTDDDLLLCGVLDASDMNFSDSLFS